MGYVTPPAVAADITFGRPNYVPPPGSALDIDFASDGGGGIAYSRVPGVIANFRTPWNPKPGVKQSAIAALFGQAEAANIRRSANASSASKVIEPKTEAPFNNAPEREISRRVSWDDSIQARETSITAPSRDAPDKDITARRSSWENASVSLDRGLGSPFLVRTPTKDRELIERYFSSAIYAALWRKPENHPVQFQEFEGRGRADLDFYDQRNIRRPGILEIGGVYENNPIQPKDPRYSFPSKNALTRDIESFYTPWGAGRPIDITRAVVSEAYSGPIGDGGNDGDDSTFQIPTLRFYIVSNSAQIVRVSDGRDIAASSVSLSINASSYAWEMSATLAGRDAVALVEGADGQPVEVDVIINGESWRVLVDSWSLSEAWRRNTTTIRGRSRAAYLGAPYALPRDYREDSELLAAQLAEQELPPGWALDFSVEDWLVDAGAWNYQGLAPIDAIARIAAAGGGYVQADKFADTIHVKPLYPAAPWNWINEAPDFLVPRDALIQRTSDKTPGLGLDGVFVHGGENGGILAKVVRSGTAGASLASTIVDPLITDVTPARHRGVAALAATSRQATEVYDMPLSGALGGLIEPGALVSSGEVFDGSFASFWRGIVRGVTVTAGASRSNNGGTSLSVRQKIQIERHFGS